MEELREKFGPAIGKQIHLHNEDFFNHTGSYDLIWEQTFLCALHPSLRQAYVKKMHSLLKPSGRLAGSLFNDDFTMSEMPPFGGDKEEYLTLFSPFFKVLHMEPATNSIPQRAGRELFFEVAV
jgi:SAM-dependent methyltransferase